MKFRQLLLLFIVATAMCISAPAFGSTIVFSDDFETSTYGALPDDPAVGTWSELDGTPGTAPNHAIAGNFGPQGMGGSNYFGAVIKDGTIGWNYMAANFTEELTNPTDVVQFDVDVYGNASTPHIAMYSTTGDYVAYVMISGGTVYVPGGSTAQTFNQDAWNNLAIVYSPGADNFDLTINGATVNVPAYDDGSGIGGNVARVQFAQVNGSDWTCVDNVLVTVTSVPEPSTLALLGCGLFGLLVCGRRRR